MHPTRRLVEIRFEGTLSPKDLAELRAETLADEHFDPTFSQLIDGRGITSLEGVGTNTVEELATQRDGVYVQGARRAFVAASDLGFGLSRVFQALADANGDVRVFRDYDDATRWLDDN